MTGLFLNLGCGSNILPAPWRNHDAEVDIFKRLPFDDESTQFILLEHCVEHGSPQEAWGCFEECYRILKPGGVVRVCVPDASRICFLQNDLYRKAVRDGGHGENPVKAAVFCHGHKSAWTGDLLQVFMVSIGFKATQQEYGVSPHKELNCVDGHGKVVGDKVAIVETAIVEGIKP